MIACQSSFLTLFVLYSLLYPLPVLAHDLKTDGSIGAVLHLDPEDEPIAKQPSNFFFEFKDTKNSFKLEKCDCEVFIFESGRQLYAQPLTPISKDSPDSSTFSFAFPEKDVYQVKVFGKPNVYQEFPNFTLTYDVRVDREKPNSGQNQVVSTNWFSIHAIHLIGGGIVLTFLILALFKQRFKSSK